VDIIKGFNACELTNWMRWSHRTHFKHFNLGAHLWQGSIPWHSRSKQVRGWMGKHRLRETATWPQCRLSFRKRLRFAANRFESCHGHVENNKRDKIKIIRNIAANCTVFFTVATIAVLFSAALQIWAAH